MRRNSILDQTLEDKLLELRRDIHQNPELSHREVRTSNRVRKELEAAGVGPVASVGKTGLAVDIAGKGAGPDRKVGIRGDMDALPIGERTGLEFASRAEGVMHACGHDAHTAMTLAAGLHLHRNRDGFSGTVRLLFQHSEETLPSGAKEFVEAGQIDDLDAVIGIHVDPMIDAGLIAAQSGTYACSSDHFDIVVSGTSSHGGKPHEGVDAIAIGTTLALELNKIAAHNVDPMVPLTITVGMIRGGTAHNIVAETASLHGTIRSGDEAVRSLAKQRLERLAKACADMHGGTATVGFEEDAPVLVNDAQMVCIVRGATADVAGADAFVEAPMWTASDDFAYFSARRPGVYFRLGVGNVEAGHVHHLHHPEFSIDEAALPLGASVLVRSALRYLADTPSA